jgi:hypothetical protein
VDELLQVHPGPVVFVVALADEVVLGLAPHVDAELYTVCRLLINSRNMGFEEEAGSQQDDSIPHLSECFL